MRIDSSFDGGNIEVIGVDEARAELAIRADSNAEEFRQWFCFRVEEAPGAPAKAKGAELRIVNAAQATYADAWDGYAACASYDPSGATGWFRAPTRWDGETLVIDHRPDPRRLVKGAALTYAYFAPFPFARHEQLLARARRSKGVRVEDIGKSVQGRPMSLVVVGDERDDRRRIWVTGRQHPGETMAEWFVEGVVERLLSRDELSRTLLDRAVFYLVPNMNPDGGVLGNLRANAAGMNLNRAWIEPTEAESPEVLAVRNRMHDTGVDLFLDVHGDERNPYCFLAGCEGNPSYDDRIRGLENLFEQSLVAFDEDFQDEYGYDRDEPGGGDLRTAGNYVGEAFECLSYTVEMPFKDAANHPDPARGWTPERAKKLGRAALESVAVCLDDLR